MYPAGLTTACEFDYATRTEVERSYPLGTQIGFVAQADPDGGGKQKVGRTETGVLLDYGQALHIGEQELPGGISLQAWPRSQPRHAEMEATVTRYGELLQRSLSVAQRLYQRRNERDSLYHALRQEQRELSQATSPIVRRLEFELHRDLITLDSLAVEDRIAVLARIAYYWWRPRGEVVVAGVADCQYTTMVHVWLPEAKDRNRLAGTLSDEGFSPLRSAEQCNTAQLLERR